MLPTPGGRTGALPNLIVIGAMKCGTSSLHRYLDLHPEIRMSRPKELEFFIEERNWPRGVAWYRSRFSARFAVRGETSPNYTDHPRFPGVPERMHAIVPDAKLVFLVRDPIERMLSHYVHLLSVGRESRPAAEALTAPLAANSYLRRSLYYMQLERYLEHFPASRILVLSAEELLERRRGTLRRAFTFLGVDPGFTSIRFAIRRHCTRRMRRKTRAGRWLERTAPMRRLRRIPKRYRWPLEEAVYYPFSRRIERPRLSAEIRAELHERLKPDADALRRFTGYRWVNWSV